VRACVLQGGRFVSDGVLTSAEQIFYLLPNEIEEVISARANIAKLDPIVQFEERGAAVSSLLCIFFHGLGCCVYLLLS
jgi:hypothetical protein